MGKEQLPPHDDVTNHIFNLKSALNFRIKTIEECYPLAETIQILFCNETDRDLLTACHELLLNAIEHGNYEISAQEKLNHLKTGTLMQLIHERAQNAPYNERYVSVICQKFDDQHHEHIQITISDQGKGFNWRDIFKNNQFIHAQPRGRGLIIAQQICFDTLQFNAAGNQVIGSIIQKNKQL